MTMLNNYLLCAGEEKTVESGQGFIQINLNKFKVLEVIASSEEDVPKGSKVKVSVNTGQEDEEGIYIHRSDIISYELP